MLLEKKLKNSRSNSVSPSQDPNRAKKKRKKSKKSLGSQVGHLGSTLKQVDSPDEIISLKVYLSF